MKVYLVLLPENLSLENQIRSFSRKQVNYLGSSAVYEVFFQPMQGLHVWLLWSEHIMILADRA